MAHKEEIKVIHIHAVIRKRKSEGCDELSNQVFRAKPQQKKKKVFAIEVNSILCTLWLVRQTPNILCYSPRSLMPDCMQDSISYVKNILLS